VSVVAVCVFDKVVASFSPLTHKNLHPTRKKKKRNARQLTCTILILTRSVTREEEK
jgi:hypothetical protein